MPKTVMIAEYALVPGRKEDFRRLMVQYAKEALEHFDGLEQFDILIAADDTDLAFAYEVFSDDAAYRRYSDSGWVSRIRTAYQDMVGHRRIVKCSRE